jgi:hypothetical protein
VTDPLELARQRFLETFEVVGREGEHLAYSLGRLSSLRIDAEWVRSLEHHPELAERLGVLSSAEAWLAARKLRNRLVDEYMRDPRAFAEALNLAQAACDQLFDTYERLRRFSRERMTIAPESIPPAVNVTARRN